MTNINSVCYDLEHKDMIYLIVRITRDDDCAEPNSIVEIYPDKNIYPEFNGIKIYYEKLPITGYGYQYVTLGKDILENASFNSFMRSHKWEIDKAGSTIKLEEEPHKNKNIHTYKMEFPVPSDDIPVEYILVLKRMRGVSVKSVCELLNKFETVHLKMTVSKEGTSFFPQMVVTISLNECYHPGDISKIELYKEKFALNDDDIQTLVIGDESYQIGQHYFNEAVQDAEWKFIEKSSSSELKCRVIKSRNGKYSYELYFPRPTNYKTPTYWLTFKNPSNESEIVSKNMQQIQLI